MAAMHHTKEETCDLGRIIYERDLRARLEPARNGQFVAIDVDSGDYEVAGDAIDAVHGLRTRRPEVVPYIHRVGYPAAYKLGGSFRVVHP